MRLVSVLFVDLVGFTALSESRDAEDVRELLGRYFDSARTIVERYGGVVEKFIGDAVMAVWGAPVAREDDAERAVRAALEIVDAVSVFGDQVGDGNLKARAGVVTGQVAALDNPSEGLVVGDRVNTASRVQSAAEPGSVLVDEVTRQVTSASIAYEDAGEHIVKGKAEPLRLWRAVRVVAGVGGSEREQGLDAPFVGRDGDLRLVKELFHGSLERRSARLVAVSGEAGIGKSRLRREFFNYIDGLADTILWHSGRCLSHGKGVAYWALAEMVRQRMSINEEASEEDASAKLALALDRWIPDAAEREFLAPRLGALLGVAEPGLGREELFAGWRLFFERLADNDPVALVFEDLQWADEGLLEFIESMLDWSASSPIFVLTLARPELASGREGWPVGRRGATTLVLEPLDDASMRRLLNSLVDGVPEASADRIVAQAEGVPLYALETVRALVDRGVLAEQDGRLALDGELGELDVPASLSSLLAARLDALEPEERGLVKAMSVFGGSFPRSAAASLGDVPEDRLDAVLAALVRKQVFVIRADRLSPDQGQYAFAQGLLRTVAYEMLSRQERKPRHLAAAEHLRRVFANDGEDVAEVVASHYLHAYHAAGDDPDADRLRAQSLAALKRAGQRAMTVGAPEAAGDLYRTAIELAVDEGERIELTAAAAGAAYVAGRNDAALELWERVAAARVAGGREDDAARVTPNIARALMGLGRNEEAAGRITAALEILGSERLDPDVGLLNSALGGAMMNTGDYDTAGAAIEAALVIGQALKLPDVIADTLSSRANIYLSIGRVEEARLLFDGALDVARRHELPEPEQRAQVNRANLAMLWDLPDAPAQTELALVLARRRGSRRIESIAAGNLMAVLLLAGRWEEMERLGAELLDEREDRPLVQFAHYRLARLAAHRGLLAVVRGHMAIQHRWKGTDNEEETAMLASAEVNLALAEGQTERALQEGMQGLPHAIKALGASHDSVRDAWPDAVDAALALGRLDDGAALVALLAEQPPGHIPPYLAAQLARGRGLVAAARGRHDTVQADLEAAIAGLQELGYPYWIAVAQTDLANWLVGQERPSEAAALLDDATTSLTSLGAAPALARAHALRASMAPAGGGATRLEPSVAK
jgi:class 3 adenylate cyclase/tetratricopeptide (TPR) repeat protein